MPYWDHKIPNTRPYRADEGQASMMVSAAMTQMTMGGAGANKVSGVLSEASCSGAPHYKKEDDPFWSPFSFCGSNSPPVTS